MSGVRENDETADSVVVLDEPRSGVQLREALKRMVDVTLALAALIASLPLMVPLIFLVKRDGGAAFYAQRRVGKGGAEFRCYKFRSMVPNAEAHLQALLATNPEMRREYETFWKLQDDPRVTRIGRFLRRYSLDELPQLFNVLNGTMSLVGPRPRSVKEFDFMAERFPQARAYVEVRPGITGPWQVSGRNEIGLAEKAELDAGYCRNWSLTGDIGLMLATVPVVIGARGAG